MVRFDRLSALVMLVLSVFAGWVHLGGKHAQSPEFYHALARHARGERGDCSLNPLGGGALVAPPGRPFQCGLVRAGADDSHELEVYAYTMPPGKLGWSNVAFVVDKRASETLMIDVLHDRSTTRRALEAVATLTDRAPVKTLLHTHADVDHIYGAAELPDAVNVVATRVTAQHIAKLQEANWPTQLTRKIVFAALLTGMLDVLRKIPRVGESYVYPAARAAADRIPLQGSTLARAATFLHAYSRPFLLHETTDLRVPNSTLNGAAGELLGGRVVARRFHGHSEDDIVLFVPDAGVVIAGDLLVAGIVPLVKVGPLSAVLEAVDAMLKDARYHSFVPGHGPVVDRGVVQQQRELLAWLASSIQQCVDEKISDGQCEDRVVTSLPTAFHELDERELLRLPVRAELAQRRGKPLTNMQGVGNVIDVVGGNLLYRT